MQAFFTDADYLQYLAWVAEGSAAAGVAVLAYCLMPNHVHFILVPTLENGLRLALAGPHRRYADLINSRFGWQGHLWQERFHSFPMDDDHLVAAARYVEMNPVRARLAPTPQAWRWSSARAHVEGRADALVAERLPPPLDAIGNWSTYLSGGTDADDRDAHARLRQHTVSGLPLGSQAFVERVERRTGKVLHPRQRGRPAKPAPALVGYASS